ncbi:hypothetical protein [Nocardia sp. XZ_19_385]|uniref:hypothetical protein n=1 Tax=Nocardia sp. XZ_19_385 TaxID=2769488 RepID=UPI00188FA359|nr:hypothetical protein [Nocardia sp. XZ_19_385]
MPGASAGKRTLKSRRVSYTLPAAVAVSLLSAGCGSPDRAVTQTAPTTVATTSAASTDDPTDVAVCVDPTTSIRVPDDQCNEDTSKYRHYWYSHTPNLLYPAIGAAIIIGAGTFIRPTTGRLKETGVPAAGGKIVRGGFGKSNNTSSGSGG